MFNNFIMNLQKYFETFSFLFLKLISWIFKNKFFLGFLLFICFFLYLFCLQIYNFDENTSGFKPFITGLFNLSMPILYIKVIFNDNLILAYPFHFNEVLFIPKYVFKYSHSIVYYPQHFSSVFIEYRSFFVFFLISVFLCVLFFLASYFLVRQNPESEKTSSYECGFEPYEDSRHIFDIRFYLLAIFFIIFDIEIIFILPWCASLSILNTLSFWSMLDFIFELVLVFGYLGLSNSLLWDSTKI